MNHEMIETRTAKIWLDEDGILRANFIPDKKGTLADAQEVVTAFAQLAGDHKRPVLVQLGNSGGSRDSREFGARESVKYISAGMAEGIPMNREIIETRIARVCQGLAG